MNIARKAQFVGTLLAIFAIGALAQAATKTVNHGGGADFTSLAAALHGIADNDTIQFTDAAPVVYDEGATKLDWAAMNVPMDFTVTCLHPNTVTIKVWNDGNATGGRVYSFSDITFLPATTTTYGDNFDTNGGAPTFINCVFDGQGFNANRGFTSGGGVLTLTNCTVQNFQGGYSWPILLDWAATLHATGTTFKDTQCSSIGGFGAGFGTTISLDHCAFVNTPQLAGYPAIMTNASVINVTNTTFQTTKSTFFGVRNDYATQNATDKAVAHFKNCKFTAPATGADCPLITSSDQPAIDGTFENCIFDGADSAIWGSGKASATPSTFKLNHCLLLQKFAGWGAAIMADDGTFDTFELKNCIIDSLNEGIHLGGGQSQLLTTSTNNLLDKGGWNDNNIGPNLLDGRGTHIDPLFVNEAAGDYRLTEPSPCLGKGVVTALTTDFLGKPRPMPVGSAPDLGPYEYFLVPVELSAFSVE